MDPTQTAVQILAAIALILAVIGLCKPAWPVVAVAVLLLSIDVFLLVHGKR
jgi:hypothetical protein